MEVKKNFFEFEPKHPSIADFTRDLERSQQIYSDSYRHLNRWDEVQELHASGDEHFDEIINYYRDTCQLHADMQLGYTNLLISYYAFRKVAERDEQVMAEFKKMPPDFSVIEETFTSLLEGYQNYMNEIRKLL